jgi:hypothetical protein
MSRMLATSSPALCSDLIAVSRPPPGPLTYTSTRRMPASRTFLATDSAASRAAKGVPFFVPLNPTVPELAHATTAPSASVIVTIVLLKLDCT